MAAMPIDDWTSALPEAMFMRPMNPSSPHHAAGGDRPAASFTVAGMLRGVQESVPLAISVCVYGAIFGLLAKTAQLALAEALLMSAAVYSGSAQMVALNAFENGAIPAFGAALATMTTILLLNARYVLYGAAIRPWLGQATPLQAYSALFFLGDGNWVLSMKAADAGERDAGYILGSGAAMFVPWVGGTAVGMLAAGFVGDPRALGLDFMLVAFCAAMAAGMTKTRSDVAVLGAAALAAIVADRLLPQGFAVMAAAAAGGLVAWMRHGETAQ
jgi:predicted branched-subunit amino acid permease